MAGRSGAFSSDSQRWKALEYPTERPSRSGSALAVREECSQTGLSPRFSARANVPTLCVWVLSASPNPDSDNLYLETTGATMGTQSCFRRLFNRPILRGVAAIFVPVALAWSGPAIPGEIHDATKIGDVSRVKALRKANPDLVFSRDSASEMPLSNTVSCAHECQQGLRMRLAVSGIDSTTISFL